MKPTLALPFLLGLAVSEVPTCGGSDLTASLTMQFTARIPPQIAPTSTVYGAIMTSFLNVVDCRYVMVEIVEDNPVQTGQFTALTTVPVLTAYRVGCMIETSASTRGDYQAYLTPVTKSLPTITALPGHSHNTVLQNKRTILEPSHANEVLDIAERLYTGIDPMNENITVREFQYLEQINTALFALNIVNAGFDLNQTCEYLNNATIGNRLEDNMINASQAANIICFAAEYGLYFGMSNGELLADLAALEYAIQLHSYATKTLQQLCQELDYTAASFLGIDTDGIRTYICNGTQGLNSTISPLSTAATSTMGVGSMATAPTGHVSPTGTVSIIYGSNGPILSSAASAAGTVAPWFNGTTVTATRDVTTVTASPGTVGPELTIVPRPLVHTPRPHPPQVRQHVRYQF